MTIDQFFFWTRAEKTINDEETNNVDVAEMMADLKVCYIIIYVCSMTQVP